MLFIIIADAATSNYRRRELSEYARARLADCKNEKRRREIMLGDAVRDALFTEISAQNDPIKARDGGKPYLPNRCDVSFNISHSGELALGVLLTEATGEIGCDIEQIKRDSRCNSKNRIMRRAFTEAERSTVQESDDPTAEFYAVWTKKEAYLKYTGKGITVPLATVDTTKLASVCKFNTFTVSDSDGEKYAAAVCMPLECAALEAEIEFIQ